MFYEWFFIYLTQLSRNLVLYAVIDSVTHLKCKLEYKYLKYKKSFDQQWKISRNITFDCWIVLLLVNYIMELVYAQRKSQIFIRLLTMKAKISIWLEVKKTITIKRKSKHKTFCYNLNIKTFYKVVVFLRICKRRITNKSFMAKSFSSSPTKCHSSWHNRQRFVFSLKLFQSRAFTFRCILLFNLKSIYQPY